MGYTEGRTNIPEIKFSLKNNFFSKPPQDATKTTKNGGNMYAVMRMGKLKSTGKNGKGGRLAHNHRTAINIKMKEHINDELSHLNLYTNDHPIQSINERVAALKKKPRKDAVISIEMILSASPKFFDGIEKDRIKLDKNKKFRTWVNDSQRWAEDEFGPESIIDIALHMDEKTPHMHVIIFPKVNPQTGNLSAKAMMTKTQLEDWQTSYAAAMAKHGLKRGIRVKDTLAATGKKIWHNSQKTYYKKPELIETIRQKYAVIKAETKKWLETQAARRTEFEEMRGKIPAFQTQHESQPSKAKPNSPQNDLKGDSSHFHNKNEPMLTDTKKTPKNAFKSPSM